LQDVLSKIEPTLGNFGNKFGEKYYGSFSWKRRTVSTRWK
jgi:hypothetical protein